MAEAVEPTPIVEALIAEIEQRGPQRGLIGAQAGMVVRRVAPEFSLAAYGAKSFRDFVERHAPQIRVIGKSGLDLVYGLASWSDLSVGPGPTRDPRDEFWRVWTSPKSPLSLQVGTDGSVETVHRGVPSPPESVRIEPAEVSVHRGIARAFLERSELNPELRSALEAAVDSTTDDWWRQWLEVTRRAEAALGRNWQQFRQERLTAELEERLKSRGLAPDAVARALSAIVATRSGYPKPQEQQPSKQIETSTRGTNEKGAEVQLVSVVQRAVASMSERELRMLWLPVGAVLDALRSRHSE